MIIKTKIGRISLWIALVLMSALLGTSCKTDFDLNEKYKEIHIIYGLLSQQDSFFIDSTRKIVKRTTDNPQYIRIEKAFLNNNVSAYQIAAQTDSLYIKNLTVNLEVSKDGNTQIIPLTEDRTINKDGGSFGSTGALLYKTPADFHLDPAATYTIRTLNKQTGVSASASTPLVGQTDLDRTLTLVQTLDYTPNTQSTIKWSAAKNARFYDLTFYIYYKEWTKNQMDTVVKVVEWPLLHNFITDNLQGGFTMGYGIKGSDFYTFMSQQIKADLSKQRYFVGTDVVIDAGAEEIYNYITVNQPSIGVVQKLPEYTNVKNGFGVFSSKSRTRIFKTAQSGVTRKELKSNAQTRDLNFIY